CPDGIFWPGGIDFAACHIFDVISVTYEIILCGGIVRSTVMNHHSFRNYYPAENDLAGSVHRFYLIFWNFFWIIAKECMGRNYNILEIFPGSGRSEKGLLGSSGIREDFCTGNFQVFISFFGNAESIL